MKKYIKILSIILILLFTISFQSFGQTVEPAFYDGFGPKVNNYIIDYKYSMPIKNVNDATKYPLVIWFHGMADYEYPGEQLGGEMKQWAKPELQERFKEAGGAYIFVPRAPTGTNWDKSLITPIKLTIDDFIQKNINNIDVSRIYIGGYSLGGWMTLHTAAAYPEMFAAVFAFCPAWGISDDDAANLKDLPVWLTSGKNDYAVSYYMTVTPSWNKIISHSNVIKDCRFSSLDPTTNPDGSIASNGHSSWAAVENDMFSIENEKYPNMSTVNGEGCEVTLTYPDGMISWLSSFTSNYNSFFEINEAEKDSIIRTSLNSFFDAILQIVDFLKFTIKYIYIF